jgi:hypothetical protein
MIRMALWTYTTLTDSASARYPSSALLELSERACGLIPRARAPAAGAAWTRSVLLPAPEFLHVLMPQDSSGADAIGGALA